VLGEATFVTRTKAGVLFNRLASRPVDRATGVRSDHVVVLRMKASAGHYPERLRRVAYRDPESGKVLVFLTNNFSLPPEAIAHLYKLRWRVELFFKWIKQNLRIKHFFGTSENAVKTQVWIAICVYVQVAILRRELGIAMSLSQILQVLSIHPFEQVPLAELLAKATSQTNATSPPNQLMLWE
jgi:IS4 transposase